MATHQCSLPVTTCRCSNPWRCGSLTSLSYRCNPSWLGAWGVHWGAAWGPFKSRPWPSRPSRHSCSQLNRWVQTAPQWHCLNPWELLWGLRPGCPRALSSPGPLLLGLPYSHKVLCDWFNHTSLMVINYLAEGIKAICTHALYSAEYMSEVCVRSALCSMFFSNAQSSPQSFALAKTVTAATLQTGLVQCRIMPDDASLVLAMSQRQQMFVFWHPIQQCNRAKCTALNHKSGRLKLQYSCADVGRAGMPSLPTAWLGANPFEVPLPPSSINPTWLAPQAPPAGPLDTIANNSSH